MIEFILMHKLQSEKNPLGAGSGRIDEFLHKLCVLMIGNIVDKPLNKFLQNAGIEELQT
jgi:hypothetical protein